MEYRDGEIYISDTQKNRIRKFPVNNAGVGVDEFGIGDLKLKIYPNPAGAELYINMPNTKGYDLEIFNTLGSLIVSKKSCVNRSAINISALNKGLYYYKIKTQKLEFTGRLVKE